MADLEKGLVKEANKRLKSGNIGVRLKLRGNRISLRATLPAKDSSIYVRSHQQVISTGIRANKMGIRYAEAKARELGVQLDSGVFDWKDWDRGFKSPDSLTVAEAVEQFEKHYRETHSVKERTWKNGWLKTFSQLPQSERVTGELLKKFALSKQQDTQTRLVTCSKLQHLANFCGIDIDLLQYKGNYSPQRVNSRKLPSDKEILRVYHQIEDEEWRWLYSAIAAGGLRPHEAFFCHWSSEGLEIEKGKTGPRTVRKLFHPEWVQDWRLEDIKKPDIDYEGAYEAGTLGKRIGAAFKGRGVPFSIYDLRHAAAVRMALYRVPTSMAARWMGHSVQIHMRLYQRHINRAMEEMAIAQAVNSSDRPLPPSL